MSSSEYPVSSPAESEAVDTKKLNISIREMPVALWAEFRSACIRQNVTVEAAVTQAINDWLVDQITKEAKETDNVPK